MSENNMKTPVASAIPLTFCDSINSPLAVADFD